jgi:hypothetical protein
MLRDVAGRQSLVPGPAAAEPDADAAAVTGADADVDVGLSRSRARTYRRNVGHGSSGWSAWRTS